MVHNELQQNEKFLSDFKRSVGYLKVKSSISIIINIFLSTIIVNHSQWSRYHHNHCTFLVQLLAELDLLKGELDEDDDMHNIGEWLGL